MKKLQIKNLSIFFHNNEPVNATLQYGDTEYVFQLYDKGFNVNGRDHIISNRFQDPNANYKFAYVSGETLACEEILDIVLNIPQDIHIQEHTLHCPPEGYISFSLQHDQHLAEALGALDDAPF